MEFEVGSHPWGPHMGESSETGVGSEGQQWSLRWNLPYGTLQGGPLGMRWELEVSPWGQSKRTLYA